MGWKIAMQRTKANGDAIEYVRSSNDGDEWHQSKTFGILLSRAIKNMEFPRPVLTAALAASGLVGFATIKEEKAFIRAAGNLVDAWDRLDKSK